MIFASLRSNSYGLAAPDAGENGLARVRKAFMERTTFFEHYRVCVKDDSSPQEFSRTGAAITYKAVDIRSGESVAVKLIPTASVDPSIREQLEEQARVAQLLDHINIAKLHAFGVEDDQFVFVSEYPQGGTVDAWVASHGPMPPEGVLRIALQIVSALNAASFHGMTHRAIQPSNLGIVPGETAEGGWPFVKLMNFGSANLKLDSHHDESREADPSMAIPFASPEQLQHGMVDFRSEIYSLGATMYFLMTGRIHSPESRLQQLRRFPKPVRNLLTQTLQNNPAERPQDPVAFAEEIRECLRRVEQRQSLARRFGIPFFPTIPETIEQPRARLPRKALALAALVLTLGTLAAVLLPEDIVRTVFHRKSSREAIGVPVGVAETTPMPIVQNSQPAPVSALAPASALSNATNASPIQAAPSVSNQPLPTSSPAVASANQTSSLVAQASPNSGPASSAQPNATSSGEIATSSPVAEPASPAEGPQTARERTAGAVAQQKPQREHANAEAEVASGDAASPSRSSNQRPTDSTAKTTKTSSNRKAIAPASKRSSFTASKRTRLAQVPRDEFQSRSSQPAGSFRARFLGTTPDGRWILELPSGDTTIVTPPPDEQPAHHRLRHRVLIERRPILLPPPPPFGPMFPPDA